MDQARNTRRDHVASLDLLRLAAAFAVLIFHYFFRGPMADGHVSMIFPEVAPYAIYGSLGVAQFFMISGFVIAWSAEGRDWHSFAVARFVRLYPGFVACMTVTFLVCLAAQSPLFPVTIRQYLANLTMFSRIFREPFMDGAYWSIVLEIIFYGWVALALAGGVFHRFKLELMLFWLVVTAANEFWLGSGAVRILFITAYSPFFISGVLLHHMLSRGRSAEGTLLYLAAFLMSVFSVLQDQAYLFREYGISFPPAQTFPVTLTMHLIMIAAIVFRRLFRPSSLMLALGGLTYPLYLLHQHIGYIAIDSLLPDFGRWAAVGVTTLAMVCAAFIIWRFIERPAQAVMKPVLTSWTAAVIARLKTALPVNFGPTART